MSIKISQGKAMEIPIIQGGMGIGISLGNLAGHVAKEGGMGVISTACIGFKQEGFWGNSREKNKIALQEEIGKAKEISKGNGLVAINAMVCTTGYEEMLEVAVACGVDAIISGAGLPLSLPRFTKNKKTAISPIVSSARAATVLCKRWDKDFSCAPDFVVIEGANAGGHLGFPENELKNNLVKPLEQLLIEVVKAVQPFAEKYEHEIPVFVAGGIKNNDELEKYLALGAAGIQVATPFIATEECDASEAYKQQYILAQNSDLCIMKSPVGLPCRAIKTPFAQKMQTQENICVKGCIHCIHTCNSQSTPYCISRALIRAALGDVENGLFFSGSEVEEITRITTVENVISQFLNGGKSL